MNTVLPSPVFYTIGGVLVLGILIGLSLMSRVKTARAGNALSAVCMLFLKQGTTALDFSLFSL